MLDTKYYLSQTCDNNTREIYNKYFGKKEFKSLSSYIYFIEKLDAKAIAWIKNPIARTEILSKKESLLIALKEQQVSFTDKLNFVLEHLEINNSSFPEFEFKENRQSLSGGICPNCNKKSLFVPDHGKATSIKCSKENNCAFHSPIYKYLKDSRGLTSYGALEELASLSGVDLIAFTLSEEVFTSSNNSNVIVDKKIAAPRKAAIATINYESFDIKKEYKTLNVNDYVSKYSKMNDKQQFMMIVTSIYKYSLQTKQWGKENFYSSRGISFKQNPSLKEKIIQIKKEIGFLHVCDLSDLVKNLIELYPSEDLIKYGVINNSEHKYPYSFKHSSKEGFCVIPNFDLYSNMITGLKLRNTKMHDWQDKNMKEPELSYGRIATPLPYALKREHFLNNELTFRFQEGSIDSLSIPFANNCIDIAIPGVNGIQAEQLGLFKGRSIELWFDQDEAGQKGAAKLKEALEKAGATVVIIKWEDELGSDINEVLQNNKIANLMQFINRRNK